MNIPEQWLSLAMYLYKAQSNQFEIEQAQQMREYKLRLKQDVEEDDLYIESLQKLN